MKKVSGIFLFMLFTACSFAQWTWQNPLPQGNDLVSTFFTDANTGYAVSFNGTILKTIDGGSTWTFLPSGTNEYLESVFFTDANTGYVAGDGGTILKTINGGATWTALSTGTSTGFKSIYFPDANTGYAVSWYNTIAKTTDGGLTWSVLSLGFSYHSRSIFFTDDSTGYIAGDGILKTIDGGLTWTVSLSGLNFSLNSLFFISSNTGYAVGGGGTIFKTVNGGVTWTALLSGTDQDFLSVYFTDINIGYAVGSGETIAKTTDGGLSWDLSSNTTSKALNSVFFIGAGTGYAAGQDGVILKTINGGASWIELSNGPNTDLYSIYFPEANTGYATGDFGRILKTSNGGSTWSVLSSGTTELLNSVYFTDVNTGYIAGGNWWTAGIILKTNNGGTTWDSLSVGTVKPLNSIRFIGANTGFAVGDSGTIIKTSDGGQTWISLPSGITDDLYSVCFTDSLTGYVVGGVYGLYTEKILKTTDGGTNWFPLANGSTNPLSSIYFTDAVTGYASGWDGTILKTINSGTTWTALSTGTNTPLMSVYFPDANTGYAVGQAGVIIKTINGGITWTEMPSGTDRIFRSVFFTDVNTGYVAGWNGAILKTTGGICHAAFTVVQDSTNNPPNTCHFIDQSTGNIATWSWNFGDPPSGASNISTLQNPTHIYSQPGSYIVCLSIQGFDSTCYDYTCDTIVVGSAGVFVSINGTVTNYLTSSPMSNHAVTWGLPQDTLIGPRTIYTNSNGFYADSVLLPQGMVSGPFYVWTEDCEHFTLFYSSFNSSNYNLHQDFFVNCELNPPCQAKMQVAAAGILTVQFEDQSTGSPTSRIWDFGDGHTSIMENPIHTYSSQSDYNVTLSITNNISGCSSTTSKTIHFADSVLCNASFSFSKTSNPRTIQFQDNSSGGNGIRHWYFADDDTSTAANPQHTFRHPGLYYVVLEIGQSGSSCNQTKIKAVLITDSVAGCQANFTYNINPAPENYTVDFTDLSTGNPSTWLWDFGGGYTSALQNPSFTFPATGTYPVCLTISGDSCSSTFCNDVVIQDSLNYHQVYGQVFAGNFPNQYGSAMIFSLDSNLTYSPYVEVCNIDSNGVYFFTMVPDGNYVIYAVPQDSTGYLPTYYGDALNWAQATVLILGEPLNPYNINLIQSGYMPQGPGSISGQVNISEPRSSMLDKMIMLLLDEDGNAISFVKVSESGSFDFSSMDYGIYYLHAEMAGITSDNVQVVLTPEKPHADVVMTFIGKHILGIKNMNPELEAGVIYPNPATDKFNLVLNLKEAVTIKVEIFNQRGQVTSSMIKSLGSGQTVLTLTVSDMAPGFYILRINSEKGINITRKMLIAK